MELKLLEKWINPKALVFLLEGSLDYTDHYEFRWKLFSFLNQGVQYLLLDLSKVKYLSSSGLGVFFEIKKRLEETGGQFGIFNPQTPVRRVLEIVKSESLIWTSTSVNAKSPFAEYIHLREKEENASQALDDISS